MKSKQNITTSDIVLFTSILLLHPKISFKILGTTNQAVFSIQTVPEVLRIINKARLRTLKIEVYSFNAQLRLVKGMIKDHVGRQRFD